MSCTIEFPVVARASRSLFTSKPSTCSAMVLHSSLKYSHDSKKMMRWMKIKSVFVSELVDSNASIYPKSWSHFVLTYYTYYTHDWVAANIWYWAVASTSTSFTLHINKLINSRYLSFYFPSYQFVFPVKCLCVAQDENWFNAHLNTMRVF